MWLAIVFWAVTAKAQYQTGTWVKADYIFNDLNFKATDVVEEKGQFAGGRAELGLNLLGYVAASVGGEYSDYHLNLDGQTLTGAGGTHLVTNAYQRDLRALVHFVAPPLVIAAGVAERYTYDNVVGFYKRRTSLSYFPAQITYFLRNLYVTYEQDVWRRGRLRLGDLSDGDGAGASDVELTLAKGQGFAVEVGYYIPSALGATHLFARYQKWNVNASDTLSDGVREITESATTSTLIQGGIGLGF